MTSIVNMIWAYTMDNDESALWDNDGPEGDDFRRELRRKVANTARFKGQHSAEIYSHDGITMAAVRAAE